MTAGAGTHHADPVGIDRPLPGLCPKQFHSALPILQACNFTCHQVLLMWKPVDQHKCVDALKIKPFRELESIVHIRQPCIASARTNENGCTFIFLAWSSESVHARRGYLPDS